MGVHLMGLESISGGSFADGLVCDKIFLLGRVKSYEPVMSFNMKAIYILPLLLQGFAPCLLSLESLVTDCKGMYAEP